ncbi:MAG TPA: lasso peptide biosynthesis B2 protein [Solirubrobacterales bacterium]
MTAVELATSSATPSAVRRLSLAGRARLASEIVIAYLRAQRELRRAPITAVVERLRSTTTATPSRDPNALEEALRLGRAVSRTLALLPGDTRCLRRSLVLLQLLTRRGIPARLVIAARTDPDFLAHAWVEHDGIPVLVPASDSFGRLVEL